MSTVPHMSAAAFRENGRRMIDLVADYLESLEARPVFGPVKPGDVLAQLPAHAPERGIGMVSPGGEPDADSWDAIFRDIERFILPNLNQWQHPSFFGFFPSNTSYPGILGELLSAGLGVNGFLWLTSPAITELEMRMVDWLGEALGIPEAFLVRSGTGGGVIQGTASEATLTSLVTARHRAAKRGADPWKCVAYTSAQAHSSVVKATMVAGLAQSAADRSRVRLIPTRPDHALDPRVLGEAIRADIASGLVPAWICATVGATSSTAIDPVREIVAASRDAGFDGWIHVDAAHAGSASICPEMRWLLDGLDLCDSVCINPHKWLLVNFDCDVFYVRDRAALIDSMSLTPEYLRNAASESGQVIDYRDWHIPLGRRFRALKLWFVMRHYGVEGLRAFVREGLRLAQVFEGLVREDSRFEVAAPRTINLVCFRLRERPGESRAACNARTKALLDSLNASGELYATHTLLPDPGGEILVIRMAIGGTRTEERHVRKAWGDIQAAASGS